MSANRLMHNPLLHAVSLSLSLSFSMCLLSLSAAFSLLTGVGVFKRTYIRLQMCYIYQPCTFQCSALCRAACELNLCEYAKVSVKSYIHCSVGGSMNKKKVLTNLVMKFNICNHSILLYFYL